MCLPFILRFDKFLLLLTSPQMYLPLLHTSVVGGRFKEGLSIFLLLLFEEEAGRRCFLRLSKKSLLTSPQMCLPFILRFDKFLLLLTSPQMYLPLLHTSVVGGRYKEGLSIFYSSSSKRRSGGDVLHLSKKFKKAGRRCFTSE